MFQGSNQEIGNDTQCSLFGCYQYNSGINSSSYSNVFSGEGSPEVNYKSRKIVPCLARPNSKNSKFDSSHDKGKINLSKMAIKNNSDHSRVYEKKKASNNLESKISKPLSYRSEDNSHSNANVTFNEKKFHKNGQSSISFNNMSYFLAEQQHSKVFGYQQKKPTKQSQQKYQIPMVGANMETFQTHLKPQTPFKKNIIFQYSNNEALPVPLSSISRTTPINYIYQEKKYAPKEPQIKMVNSFHHVGQINNSFTQNPCQLNIKGAETVTPTQETDRILAASLARTNKVTRERFSIQNSSHYNLMGSQYDQRLAETLGANLGIQRINTVQSFTGSDAGVSKRDVQQSVIIIDFFNPDERLKEEIEQSLRNKKKSELLP